METTNEVIRGFKEYLIEEEKSRATIDKYMRDVTAFFDWLGGQQLVKSAVLEYKLTEAVYGK